MQTATANNEDAHIARSLTWRYAVALALVASLSTAAWYSLRLVIAGQESTAAVVNVSGRQRMLSQRTALLAKMMATAPPAQRAGLHQQLQDAINLLALSHKGLTEGSADMGLPATMSDEVRAMYYAGDLPLDAQLNTYVGEVRALLQDDVLALRAEDPRIDAITRTALGPLVAALNAMVVQYQREGEASVRRLEKAETGFWLTTLLLLALEAALIFQPFIRHTRKSLLKLQQLTEELQRHRDSLEITVQERTQELEVRGRELSQSEEKFRLISTAASDGIVIIGEGETVRYWNPAAQRMFGFDSHEVMGQSVHALLDAPEFMESARQKFRAVVQSAEGERRSQTQELMARRKSGEAFPVELSISAFQFHGAWHAVVILRDISRRRMAEADLRIAATAFESQEGILVTDAQSRVLRVNSAFTRITGYPADEICGKTPAVLSSGRHDKAFYQELWRSLLETGSWEGEIWNRRKNAEVYPQYLAIAAVKDAQGAVTHYVGTFNDITVSKAAAEEIENLAFYDPLTMLPNRRLLLDRLRQALTYCERNNRSGAVLFIDLDNFKLLNDTMGHDYGDLLLQQVAERLLACVRKRDTVARIGGDEFVVVLEELSDAPIEAAAQAEVIGAKILSSLASPYDLNGRGHRNTPSIGVAMFDGTDHDMEDVLKQADIAMYQAKGAGRNSIRFFDPVMQTGLNARVEMERALREALEHDQFRLFYQVQKDDQERVLGAEVLLRWSHPVDGLIGPATFVPLAEDTGLILPIGHWVLEAACAQLRRWSLHESTRALTLAVNVSAKQFRQADFVEQVKQLIVRHEITPHLLKLELTESMLVHDVGGVIQKMNALKAVGVQFSLDDFGTGYSSLQYLRQLPLNQLKIDQSFVHAMVHEANGHAIVNAIIDMARNLGLNVIAEGVETQEQRRMLLEHGCRHYQGYLLGKPMPLEHFEALMVRPLQ